VSVHVYRPSARPYRRGAPIVSLAELHEAAHTLYAEQVPVTYSAWAFDGDPWATTTSDALIDLHTPLRLPVLPWVAELRAVVSAQNAEIGVEGGATVLFDTSARETRELVLAVTPGDAGSTRANHRLVWRRRGGSGTASVYGLALYLQPLGALPTGT
jgi:hypothetical protein